jgi:serpin B
VALQGRHQSDAAFASAIAASEVKRAAGSAAMTGAEVASAVNRFGLSLLSSLHKSSDAGGVFISPLSISSALGMVALGATPNGTANVELLGAWGLNVSKAEGFFQGLHSRTTDLMTVKKGVQVLNANSIWCSASIKTDFVAAAEDAFDAEIRPLPSSPTPVNEWCSNATQGMIPSIISNIDPLTVAVLVNAVYFKGMWATQFDKALSSRGTFTSSSNEQLPCAMMKRTDKHMRYAEDAEYQVVELPYGSGGEDAGISAVVVLPKEGTALPSIVERIGTPGGMESLVEVLEHLQESHVALQLPRFKLEFGVHDLKTELRSTFGMSHAFDGTGEFLAMSNDPELYLSSVFHKALVEVTEDGTKAAAATAGVMMTRSMPRFDPPQQMIVDHPFLFLIREVSTGMLLFAGIVENPDLDTSGV